MPPSLFTAPMEQITADDVNTFLDEELEEGPRLDYKQADPTHLIPQDVVDVICAFANTYGGLLILGVKADQTTNRPIERKGLPLVKDSKPVKNLEERITSNRVLGKGCVSFFCTKDGGGVNSSVVLTRF